MRSFGANIRCLLVYKGDELITDICDLSGIILRHKVLSYQSYPSLESMIPSKTLFSAHTPSLDLKIRMDLQAEIEFFRYKPFRSLRYSSQPAWLQHFMQVDVEMTYKNTRHRLSGKGIFETFITGA